MKWPFVVAAVIFFLGWFFYNAGVASRMDGFALFAFGFVSIGIAINQPQVVKRHSNEPPWRVSVPDQPKD
jgi:hypothetical protein